MVSQLMPYCDDVIQENQCGHDGFELFTINRLRENNAGVALTMGRELR